MTRQLDKTNQISALAATVAVEEIFAGVDIERRASFRMQRTESDELGAVTGGSGDPILLPQIIEQRQTLSEFFEVLAHGALFASGAERRRKPSTFPGKDGGWRNFLRDARAREFAEPESAKIKVQLGDRPDRRAPASEPRERAFRGETKGPVGNGPARAPSGGVWRGRARDSDL